MLKNKRIGFIGGGNMAEAIIKGMISSSLIKGTHIFVSEPNKGRQTFLTSEYKVKVVKDNLDLARKSDVLIVAVKPQIIREVLNDIAGQVDAKKLVISVAAGVPISQIEEALSLGKKKKLSVVRTMPNTPAVVQEGVTAITAGKGVSKADLKMSREIFQSVGRTVEVSEDQIDAVTGLSGSGPAYIFMIIEALSDAGVKMGLSRDVANELTVQTVLGSAMLVRETGTSPGELKNRVTSPGGTTIAGLHALEKGSLRATLMNAVEKATLRSKELAE
ncbi:MAG: pyrroline-5-carboxylate reductase [Nitrospinae bacterium]|nr:pyrroline-5-carboxylate reductase [Nitrospinota bacterium]